MYTWIPYFILCTPRYTRRRTRASRKVTRCTKLRGAQRSPELALGSTDFHAPENLIFPALEEAMITTTWISPCHLKPLHLFTCERKRIFNTNNELSQNRTEKQTMPSKKKVNWLFNDI